MATTTTQVQTNIPDYIRPYVESQLGRVSALTDINQNPFQYYSGQRVASPTGLQQQSYTMASMLRPSQQLGQATGIATNAAYRAGQIGSYMPGQFSAVTPQSVYASPWAQQVSTQQWSPQAMAQYMNPFMQGVTDIAKREAMRQSNIMGQGQNAQAVGAGAFGGSRHALVEAERQRNLAQQLNDIQMQGANAAYNNAQQMFTSDMGRGLQAGMANQGANLTAAGQNLQGQMANQNAWTQYGAQHLQAQGMGEASRQFGSNLGLQGLQTQLGAAGMLRDLGQSQYNQNIGIAGLQNQFGTQQQMTNQAGLDHQYQEWMNRQAWPYRNEEFMYNIMRGLPMNNTTSTLNTPSPSPLSQLIGAGTTLYGLNQLNKADGGIVDVLPKRETKKPAKKAKKQTYYAKGGEVGSGLADLLIAQIA